MPGLLVLGASGLLGLAVVAEAQRSSISPVVGVSRSKRRAEGTDAWHELDLSQTSVANVAGLLASTNPSAIINCTGRTHGDRPALVRANVVTVGVLLEALSRSGARPRLVHVGSAAEYAAAAMGAATREDDLLEPKTAYGVTKLAASRLVDLASGGEKIDGVVARVFNPIGPGMPASSMPGRAARLLSRAAANRLDAVALGPLEAFRDFIDTRDIAAALVRLAQAAHLEHRTYNVASGSALRVRDVVSQIAARVGFDGTVAETDRSSPRSGHVAWQRADISRLTALDWRANHDMVSSISALVASVRLPEMPSRADEPRRS